MSGSDKQSFVIPEQTRLFHPNGFGWASALKLPLLLFKLSGKGGYEWLRLLKVR